MTDTPSPLMARTLQAEASAAHWKAMARKHEDRVKANQATTELTRQLRAEVTALTATIDTWRELYRELLDETTNTTTTESETSND